MMGILLVTNIKFFSLDDLNRNSLGDIGTPISMEETLEYQWKKL